MRREQQMQPTRLQHKPAEDPIKRLKACLGKTADVRSPKDAEEPILDASVRASLFQWMAEIRAADELKSVGVKPRTNALLFGPPGCGKTTLAHHFAARLGLPMVVVGSEHLMSAYLGESGKNIAKLFDGLAAAETPVVLFMDEVEAVGASRSGRTGGQCDDEKNSALTVLLRKMEEFNVGYFMAATNLPDGIDPAFWRRFNMQIGIALPGFQERFAIIKRYGMPFTFDDDDLDLLAEATDGASPALLRELMEGVKRTLVVRPRMSMPIDDPCTIFTSVISATMPPPEMEVPKLWRNADTVKGLSAMSWPPQRMGDQA
ncbi:ATP-binding protein [Gluconobacter kondonii]|uniref:ATP-binding protein n=1 Tax=Gluconobacter kondonii TaxID=941463 RepID=UPI001B8B2771|nr:ATP-binding protein [Gluconobacter kondonii]MBS1082355.1 ATP-binding protein [Gluconobacter kondonii]